MRDDYLAYEKTFYGLSAASLLVISFFCILVSDRPRPELCILGLALTAFTVYLLSSIRLRSHHALLEALKYREMKPLKKPQLSTWYPSVFLLWLIGVLWCHLLSKAFIPAIPYFIIFIEPWTIYAAYFAVHYHDRIKILKNQDNY